MAKIVYVHPSGKRDTLEGSDGLSVMQAATSRGLDGILAECGGNAMCATCHVYVDAGWIARLPPMSVEEDALLEGTASERRSNSRLGCQLRIGPELDGLIIHLPERQT